MSSKMLFGAVVRDADDDSVDDVLDVLEDAGVDDDDWEWLVWYRRSVLMMIFWAPMSVKGVLRRSDLVEVKSLGTVARFIEDQRNEWEFPRRSRRSSKSALERALDMLDSWQDEQWSGEAEVTTTKPKSAGSQAKPVRRRGSAAAKPAAEVEEAQAPEVTPETAEEAEPAPKEFQRLGDQETDEDRAVEERGREMGSRQKRAQMVREQGESSRMTVLSAFGILDGATDSDGNGFSFYKFSETDDEEQEAEDREPVSA